MGGFVGTGDGRLGFDMGRESMRIRHGLGWAWEVEVRRKMGGKKGRGIGGNKDQQCMMRVIRGVVKWTIDSVRSLLL